MRALQSDTTLAALRPPAFNGQPTLQSPGFNMALARLLWTSLVLVVFVAVRAADDCAAKVLSSMAQARLLHGHTTTGTSPEQPAIVMPVAQQPYIPNIRFRMTIVREGSGGVLHWQLEWTQPYAVEATNRTIAAGQVIIKETDIDWQMENCTVADMHRISKMTIGVMAGVCAQLQRGEGQHGRAPQDLQQQCFQDTGHTDMLLLHPASHALQESYEFFMFFHFIVKPFCRETAEEKCWGPHDPDMHALSFLQQHALYKFTVVFDFILSDCSMESCRQLTQLADESIFYAQFHSAPAFCCLRPPCPPSSFRSPPHSLPRALFLFPENQSIGFHSPLALPWTYSSSDSAEQRSQAVLLIALNMTSASPRLIYVHLNAIPIARLELQAAGQRRPSQQLAPLECTLHDGAL